MTTSTITVPVISDERPSILDEHDALMARIAADPEVARWTGIVDDIAADLDEAELELGRATLAAYKRILEAPQEVPC